MLKLRKILLSDKLYVSILFCVIFITIFRLSIPKKSVYSPTTTKVEGIVVKINKASNQIELKAKEIIICNIKDNKLELGDKVELYGDLIKPSNNTNKYLFNYKKYLERKNIFYIMNVNKINIVSKNKNIYYKLKQLTINHLGNNPYLYTFIIGDKQLLDKTIQRSYQENGISHLFAISGMHISLLASIISKLLKKIKDEEIIYKATCLFLTLYLLLVGFSPSIFRGVLFYIFFNGNRIYYFYIKKLNIFILILSISLILAPNSIYDVGFLYSYSVSFSLLIMSEYLKSNSYFISLLKVSLISFLVSLPITLYSYQQINIMSVIYNLFFVPLVSIIVFPLSILLIFIKQLEPIYMFIIKILETSSLLLSKITIGKITFKRLPFYVYVIYFILILFFLLKKKKVIINVLFFLLLLHNVFPKIFSNNYVKNIDVGQGDSILLNISHKTILIDTGGNKYSSLYFNIISPTLRVEGINKINYLIISHGDYDHMGEAINLVNNFKVEKVIFNCGEFNDLEQELIKVLDKKKIPYYSCIKELNIDNNKLYFLQTKEYDNENDNSNVIYTEINGYKFMFMGDAGIDKEKDILDKYNISNIDVLKVGHHGSKTSSSEEFIYEINPKYSIISVGKNNRYGHPNREVLKTLEDSKIYRTDRDGSIIFKIKNNKLKIEKCPP